MKLHTSNSITDEEALVFVAKDLQQGDTDFGETEQLESRKLPLTEAIKMIGDGTLTDGVSVAALLRVAADL